MFRVALQGRLPAPEWRMMGARVLCALGVALLVLPLATGPSSVVAYPMDASESAVADALDYLRGVQLADGSIVDFGTTCWIVCAVVAADEDPADWTYAGDSLVDYLEAEVDSISGVSNYSLAIMAVVAAGEDPASFGGIDLVSLLEGEYDSNGQLGDENLLCDDFWGLMALVAAGDDANSTLVSNARDFIVSNQSSDSGDYGSWGWGVGQDGDVDDTAAAIMALMATGTSTSSSVIVDGLAYLADNQDTSGGFLSWGSTNADTDSWAILSLVAADENPDSSDWEMGVNSPVDDLLTFQQPTGEFHWQSGDPGWNIPKTTASAIQALLGRPWPVKIASLSSPGAELAVTPSDFEFAATKDGDDPLDRILEIWNEGSGTLEWVVEADEDWLDLSPSSGSSTGEHDDVTLSVDISGLNVGSFSATITIGGAGADGSPRTVDVDLEITAAATEPEIDFSPSRLRFTAEEGGDDPDDEILTIWNSGEGRLDWSVSDDAGWLSLSPRSGTSTGDDDDEEVDVSVDISGLDAGEYTAEITIKDSDASNSPEDLTVTLTVEESADEEDYYQLMTPTTPAGAGSITRSVLPDAQGYLADTQLALTAVPFTGYVFTGWTGDAAGPQNPINVVMSGNRTVMANFLRFDNSGLPNVGLTFASPGIYSVAVVPYPTASIPSSPEGFRLLSAYIVEPQGSGSFTLQFSGLPNAATVAIFKVQDGVWVQLPRSVLSDTAIEVTMGAEDPVIALVTPGSSGGGIVSSVQGLFSGADSTTLLVVGIAVLLAVIVIVVLVLYVRRESY